MPWREESVMSQRLRFVGEKLAEITANPDNQVITEDKRGDYLGTDIMVDDNGNLLADSSGDLRTINDIDNVKQIINSILSTELNAFMKMPNFGFDAKHTIGEAGVTDVVGAIGLSIKKHCFVILEYLALKI